MKNDIVSVQSHVVKGDVGNKAAVFPLQLLGHNVQSIHTVQFTHMLIHNGVKLKPDELALLLEKLPSTWEGKRKPHLLTGYMSASSLLEVLFQFHKHHIKTKNTTQKSWWVCDPVMGDRGKLYVEPSLIDMYRTYALPYADIVTPNQYELEWLSNKTIVTLQDAYECCKLLHEKGSQIIVVTSLKNMVPNSNDLILLVSLVSSITSSIETFTLQFPLIPVDLAGTGDFFAAMLLHGLDRHSNNIKQATMFALDLTQKVIQNTIQANPESTTINVLSSTNLFVQLM